ncbi:MAG TPA: DUF294 nucleotidyltransferase-like domain-containing protein [Desulfosarcina sp.]|nr:DUF294 nucleotidyltransferase-like domain-containing protein [Desulfosarcina sp.]
MTSAGRSPFVDSGKLIEDIAGQTRLDGLEGVSAGIDHVLEGLVAGGVGVREMLDTMSRLNDRLTRKVIELCQAQMQADGGGPAPAAYCWINLGSAARREQTLRTDQDNAIIYDDALGAGSYFHRLGRRVVDGLVQCGFERCSGGVMASSPQWCRPLSQWRGCVTQWMRSVDPEDVRCLTILLDYRCVWGDAGLADALWESIARSFAESTSAGHLLSSDDRKLSAPLDWRGRVNIERSGPRKGRFNLKTAALVHMINAVRLLAVSRGIATPSTLDRLDRLVDDGCLDAGDAAAYGAGFETLMMFRTRENLKRVHAGKPPDNTLDPGLLDREDSQRLKDALAAVVRLQKRIGKGFHVPWMNYFGH